MYLIAYLEKKNQGVAFDPFIAQYSYGVLVGSHLTSFIAKMSISPQRFIEVGTIPTQSTLMAMQAGGGVSYLLQTM